MYNDGSLQPTPLYLIISVKLIFVSWISMITTPEIVHQDLFTRRHDTFLIHEIILQLNEWLIWLIDRLIDWLIGA